MVNIVGDDDSGWEPKSKRVPEKSKLFTSQLEKSVLNRVGCVVMWVTWVRGLRGPVVAWVA